MFVPQSVLPGFFCANAMVLDISVTRVSPDAAPSGTGETAVAANLDRHPSSAESGAPCVAHLVQAEEDAPEATGALIRFIQWRYHDSQRADLEELLRLAQGADGHRGKGSRASHGVVALLSRTRAVLTAQMQQHETFLFPMMLSGARPTMTFLIKRVMAEHRSQLALVEEMRDLVERSPAPAASHAPWRALRFGMNEFAEELRASAHLKNAVLFPRFL